MEKNNTVNSPLFLDESLITWRESDIQACQSLHDKLAHSLIETIQPIVDKAYAAGAPDLLAKAENLKQQLEIFADDSDDLRNLLGKTEWQLWDLRHLAFDMRNRATELAELVRSAVLLRVSICEYYGDLIPVDSDGMTDEDKLSIGI